MPVRYLAHVAVNRRLFLRGSLGAGSLGVIGAVAPGVRSLPSGSTRTLRSGDEHAAPQLVPTYDSSRAERPAVHGLRGLAKQQGELPATIQVVWNGGSAVVGRAQFNALKRVEQVTDRRTGGEPELVIGYPHHWTFLVAERIGADAANVMAG